METQQEPEYPNNVHLFRLAILNNFKHIAESVSEEDFLDNLSILRAKPKTAKKLYKAMIKELYDSMIDDFEDILKEGNLEEALKKVFILSDENSSIFEDAWRPPGNVTLHLRSLDAHVIKEHTEQLTKQVNELEKENALLVETITKKRSKIFTLEDNISRLLSKAPIAIELLENRLEQLEKCQKLLNHN